MLILGSRLLNAPVMSLQTGTQLAQAVRPVIDPSNLHVVAYEVEGPLLNERPSFIRTDEIREYGRLGMIVNSNDDIFGRDEIIKLKRVYDLSFPLVGLRFVDEHKRKLGKVEDYTLNTGNFLIEQINVRRGMLQRITDTGFLVNRSQIIEINNVEVVVKSPTVTTAEPVMQAVRGEFVNPFKGTGPQARPE